MIKSSRPIDQNAPASRVIAIFGGISKMARATGFSTSTIFDWQQKGLIPQGHWPKIICAAKSIGLWVSWEDFIDKAALEAACG